MLDYDKIRDIAKKEKPNMLIRWSFCIFT